MKPLPLLTALLRQGVKFEQIDGKLRITTPKGITLSDALKTEIRINKEAILARLNASPLTTEGVLESFPGATVISDGLTDMLPDFDLEVCLRCGFQNWWISTYGVKVCEKCHPPCSASIVVARLPPRHDKAA